MWDVMVIGSGFWGTAIYRRLAAKLGDQVSICDSGSRLAGSRAASGLIRWSWLQSPTLAKSIPDWWGPAHELASRTYVGTSGVREVPEHVTTWSAPVPKQRTGLLLAEPVHYRMDDVGNPVARLEPLGLGWRVHYQTGFSVEAEKLVLAAGVWTDDILKRSGFTTLGVRPYAGSAVIGAREHHQTNVETHYFRPYNDLTLRPWNANLAQVGATLARGGDDEVHFATMMKRVRERWPDFDGVERRTGFRPVLKSGAFVGEAKPGLIVATGGGRIGLLLAGGVALRVEELLG